MESYDSFSVFWLKRLWRVVKLFFFPVIFIYYLEFGRYGNVDFENHISSEYVTVVDAEKISKASLIYLIPNCRSLSRENIERYTLRIFDKYPSKQFFSEIAEATSCRIRVPGRKARYKYTLINIESINLLSRFQARVTVRKDGSEGVYKIIVKKVHDEWKAENASFSRSSSQL